MLKDHSLVGLEVYGASYTWACKCGVRHEGVLINHDPQSALDHFTGHRTSHAGPDVGWQVTIVKDNRVVGAPYKATLVYPDPKDPDFSRTTSRRGKTRDEVQEKIDEYAEMLHAKYDKTLPEEPVMTYTLFKPQKTAQ